MTRALTADQRSSTGDSNMRDRSGRRQAWRKSRLRNMAWGYFFILPSAVLIGVFYVWPILRGLYLSFTKTGSFGQGASWTGVTNYRQLIADSEVWRALGNSFLYMGIVVVLGVPVAVVIAALLNLPRLKLVSTFRVIYFLPVVVMPVAVGLIWRLMYNGDFGLLNSLLSVIGIGGPHWLQNPNITLLAIGIVGVWSQLGYNIVLLLAGFQDIPPHFYEAAQIDGAGRIRQFFTISIPLLTPTIFFVSVIQVIQSMQMFDLLYVMLDAGTSGSLGGNNPALTLNETLVYLYYKVGFVHHNQGYASAIAMILMLVILGLTAIQFRLQKRWVHYER